MMYGRARLRIQSRIQDAVKLWGELQRLEDEEPIRNEMIVSPWESNVLMVYVHRSDR